MAYAVPDFYQAAIAATTWHHTRCTECDGRGYFRSGDRWRRICQTCAGEGTVSVPALPFYQPLENFQPLHRKPKTMAETPLPRGFSATCPCCHGQGFLLVATPCLHCEETGRVAAEVGEPDHHPSAGLKPSARSTRPIPTAKIRRKAEVGASYDPAGYTAPHAPRTPKTPKRSRHRTRKSVNSGKPTRKPRS